MEALEPPPGPLGRVGRGGFPRSVVLVLAVVVAVVVVVVAKCGFGPELPHR